MIFLLIIITSLLFIECGVNGVKSNISVFFSAKWLHSYKSVINPRFV